MKTIHVILLLQNAAAKRCKRHMLETDEFMTTNSDFILDPMNLSTAYLKMKSLCMNISSEIQTDIKIHSQQIFPRYAYNNILLSFCYYCILINLEFSSPFSSIDLPNITATIYSSWLCKRLHGCLRACSPSKPSQHVTELLATTASFERDLLSWNIRLH